MASKVQIENENGKMFPLRKLKMVVENYFKILGLNDNLV